jgi:hypothetical protein
MAETPGLDAAELFGALDRHGVGRVVIAAIAMRPFGQPQLEARRSSKWWASSGGDV